MAAEGATPVEPDLLFDQPTSLDGDLAFGESISNMTDTTSIGSSIKKYRMENGRAYHSYGTTLCWGPVRSIQGRKCC